MPSYTNTRKYNKILSKYSIDQLASGLPGSIIQDRQIDRLASLKGQVDRMQIWGFCRALCNEHLNRSSPHAIDGPDF